MKFRFKPVGEVKSDALVEIECDAVPEAVSMVMMRGDPGNDPAAHAQLGHRDVVAFLTLPTKINDEAFVSLRVALQGAHRSIWDLIPADT